LKQDDLQIGCPSVRQPRLESTEGLNSK